MTPTTKLTKRQKKGIAFRERKRGKSKNDPPDLPNESEDELDVPRLEDSVLVDVAQGPQGRQIGAETLVGERKAGAEGDAAEGRVVVGTSRSRKRKAGEAQEEGSGRQSNEPKPKRRRGSVLDGVEQPVKDEAGAGEEGEEEGEKAKQKFILFLGNLKYTTTIEVIQQHFSVCVPPPTVRLLTPKSSTKSPTKPVTKSKGCAFLEFKHRGALQQGLKLHHSQLDGRQINVELTAGGGGKGTARMNKLKERNKELEGQRRKRQDSKGDAKSGGAQRFSTTSGAEQTHVQKRTWTVGDVEDKETHRGGQKHKRRSRKGGSLVKDFGTGVNAIPVG